MKSIVLAAVLLSVASTADAQRRRFLVAQWVENGNQMCKYDDGTVLNMRGRMCRVSI